MTLYIKEIEFLGKILFTRPSDFIIEFHQVFEKRIIKFYTNSSSK